jgi:hypothetical protein
MLLMIDNYHGIFATSKDIQRCPNKNITIK